MKRLAILAAFVLATQACHRKQYALFNDPAASSYLHQETSSPAVMEELTLFADADTTGTLPEGRLVDLSQRYSSPALLKAKNPQQVSIQKKPIKAQKPSEQKLKPLFHGKTEDPKPLPSRGLGIASLVLGAVGSVLLIPSLLTLGLIGFAFVGFLLGITGLVLGTIRTIRLKKNPDERTEQNSPHAPHLSNCFTSTSKSLG